MPRTPPTSAARATDPTTPIRVEGTVAAGSRVEVELFVGGERVARGSDGDRLTLETADGPVEVDVAGLALDGVEAETVRGRWGELSSRREAALVAGSSPAPHVQAELVVRHLAAGARIAVEGAPVAHAFDEGRTAREPVPRRIARLRALRMAPPEPAAPSTSVRPRRRWILALPWVVAGSAIAATALSWILDPGLRAGLISVGVAISMPVAARFAHRALSGAPVMDEGMAHPALRFFARAARSLPRFAPQDRDATRRWATFFGPLVVAAWLFIVFIDWVWPIGTLRGDIHAATVSAVGGAAFLGVKAAALWSMAVAYLVADQSERPRVRALLAARADRGAWRALEGRVASLGEDEVLHRGVTVESDHAHSEDVDFHARNEEGGDDALEVRTGHGVVTVQRAALAWSSDDWSDSARSARLRVRDGSAAVVAGFWQAGTLVARGPESMMLFASVRGSAVEALRAGLRRRAVDALLAAAAGLGMGALAVALLSI